MFVQAFDTDRLLIGGMERLTPPILLAFVSSRELFVGSKTARVSCQKNILRVKWLRPSCLLIKIRTC